MQTARNASEALTLANINARAQRITEDYRLVWNRFENAFFVTRKEDYSRRYKVTSTGCSCPAFAKHRTCKHHLGLADLAQVEVNRYTLLGFQEDRKRMMIFLAEVESAALWNDPEYLEEMERRYADR